MTRVCRSGRDPRKTPTPPEVRYRLGVVSTRLACCLSLALSVAVGAPVRTAWAAQAPAPSALSEAQAVYARGGASYETFDYEGAIAIWTQAYAMVGEGLEERQFKAGVLHAMGLAHELAYGQDHDIAHLHQGVALLQRYSAEYRSIYAVDANGEQHLAEVGARIVAMQQQLAALTAPPAVATQPAIATQPVVAPQPVALQPQVAPPPPQMRPMTVRDVLRSNPELGAQYRRGKTMSVFGGIFVGVGGVLSIVALVSYFDKQNANGDYYYYDNDYEEELAMGIVGGSLVLTGAVLLGIGIPTKRAAATAARAQIAVLPRLSPTQAGLGAVVRF